jgi:3-hydroxyacyl-[acyl-carrier-protein] dehydratase
MFTIEEIMTCVPHRYPLLLIDKVVDYLPDKSVTTLKNVTINEAQFQGHFPGQPIFPGVYIIENIAQSACFLLVKSAGRLDRRMVYYLGRVLKMSFLKPVRPGDQLISQVTVVRSMNEKVMVSAVSKVGEALVAKGDLMFGASSAGKLD